MEVWLVHLPAIANLQTLSLRGKGGLYGLKFHSIYCFIGCCLHHDKGSINFYYLYTHSVFWAKYFESLGSVDYVSDSLLLQEVFIHDSLESSME